MSALRVGGAASGCDRLALLAAERAIQTTAAAAATVLSVRLRDMGYRSKALKIARMYTPNG
jgi:hypothetical protein